MKFADPEVQFYNQKFHSLLYGLVQSGYEIGQ